MPDPVKGVVPSPGPRPGCPYPPPRGPELPCHPCYCSWGSSFSTSTGLRGQDGGPCGLVPFRTVGGGARDLKIVTFMPGGWGEGGGVPSRCGKSWPSLHPGPEGVSFRRIGVPVPVGSRPDGQLRAGSDLSGSRRAPCPPLFPPRIPFSPGGCVQARPV